VAAVLTYMRLHVPQIAVALMYGLTQTDISRDLRRLMPAILKTVENWTFALGQRATFHRHMQA
jgi:hypothetical protein